MNLLFWATGFLSFSLFLVLQSLFGFTAALAAFLVGLLLLLIALLARSFRSKQ